MYLSLHQGRKQLLQHQQSILNVQRSMAHLQQELRVRGRLLEVGTPSLFTWLLCVVFVWGWVILQREKMTCWDPRISTVGEESDFQAVVVITDQG